MHSAPDSRARRWVASAAAVAALALAPSAAHASVAYIEPTDEGVAMIVEGSPGENNAITVGPGGLGVVATDTAGIQLRDPEPAAGSQEEQFPHCRAVSSTEVTCSGDSAAVHGRDGSDSIVDTGLPSFFRATGGPGDDSIAGNTAKAWVHGDDSVVAPTDGDDVIAGSSAPGVSFGCDAADDLNGGGGDDRIDAGPGVDEVSGQSGDDVVNGGAGADLIDATGLRDTNDGAVNGDVGNDTLVGGEGDDQINAAVGRDSVDAGDGDDFVRTETDQLEDDGASDAIGCGAGADRFELSQGDVILTDCETLLRNADCPRYPCTARSYVERVVRRKRKVLAKSALALRSPDAIAVSLAKPARGLKPGKRMALLSNLSVFERRRPVVGIGSGYKAFVLKRPR